MVIWISTHVLVTVGEGEVEVAVLLVKQVVEEVTVVAWYYSFLIS
jgi:hypothetical protein